MGGGIFDPLSGIPFDVQQSNTLTSECVDSQTPSTGHTISPSDSPVNDGYDGTIDKVIPPNKWFYEDDDEVPEIDEETLYRWYHHDPWEDERGSDSDVSFYSNFSI
ncbi:hypothetical protein L1987_07009 [Smallanthus sonchifolius]|uniref:Uncharacterized protein n=1 Tax=Smallanthus sonchifolius TaxID=185202 RepID=A0ACB9JZU2_9ASTR|nr:hypothetical protein L1987_07009 [Smallanthus sonchifolius]